MELIKINVIQVIGSIEDKWTFNLLEYMKLIKITVIQVIGSIEDKWTFSIVASIKNKLRNPLSTHLHLCTWFHSQHLFILQIFFV